ncbi:MAG: hypothetical protein ACYCZY_00835 [Lacisediminihabitans sp.]
MRAVDTNILVYAYHADFPQHTVAKRVLATLISQGAAWLAWPGSARRCARRHPAGRRLW